MTDTWTWATVTQATPLRIKVDGDTTALDATTDDLVGSLAVDDRVRVHLHSDGIIVTGLQGGGNRSNPNLLINSDFAINQEGTASGAAISTGAYFLDGWFAPAYQAPGLVSWADTGGVRTLTLGSGDTPGYADQIVETSSLPAGTYAVSWEGATQLYIFALNPVYETSPVTFTTDGTADVKFQFRGYGEALRNVKLEQGSVATPYQPSTYADNLRACMRYYQRLGDGDGSARYGVGYFGSATSARFVIPLIVPMRTSYPTLLFNDLRIYDGASIRSVSAMGSGTAGTTRQFVTATVSGATAYRPCELFGNSAASFLAFDARL